MVNNKPLKPYATSIFVKTILNLAVKNNNTAKLKSSPQSFECMHGTKELHTSWHSFWLLTSLDKIIQFQNVTKLKLLHESITPFCHNCVIL